jgi:dTDP-4-dehydrorhamnose 3,5-epimerase
MNVMSCPLKGAFVIEPARFRDDRGFFLETFQRPRYEEAGIVEDWIQDNHSRSLKNVLRGLHYTRNKPQAQLLSVIRGRIFDVIVDLRVDSPTRGRWFGVELSDEGVSQIYMPHGFAHGFCVLSDVADVQYKASKAYDAADEAGLRWNDPDFAIDWPIRNPIVSTRDQEHPSWREVRDDYR